MPKSKKRDDTSDSDSGPDDVQPVKKSKPSPAAKPASSSSGQGRGNPAIEGQEPTWDLGKNKKVKVREWRNMVFIDIREYYIDKSTMETKPGKKGISLSAQQYQELKKIIGDIDAALP